MTAVINNIKCMGVVQHFEAVSNVFHQGHLENVVRSLFPGENIKQKESQITNPKTGYFIELDIWLPDLELCFEFQDDYHYVTSWYSHVPLSQIQQKDAFKKENIQAKYVTIITVPCWWDGNPASLAATIEFQRPDLKVGSHSQQPIPFNPSFFYFKGSGVPDVGELMYASFPSYFQDFSGSISQSNPWWMGEKYDGIRVCWNPLRKSFFSRLGNIIQLPNCFEDSMINCFVDAEIWFGRGFFTEAQKIKSGDNVDYHFARVIAFDKPDRRTEKLKFDDRYSIILQSIPLSHSFLEIAPRIKTTEVNFVREKLESILKEGGEGIILRKPNSIYERGRSTSLWKLKAAREDGEALVLQAISSTNYLLQLPNGTIFEAPRNSAQEPKRGDVVSFSFETFSNKSVPIHPEIIRIRQDVTWDDVICSFEKDKHKKSQVLNDASMKMTKRESTSKPTGYWTDKSRENMKMFFEKFAKSRSLDPRDPVTWYSLSLEFIKEKGAKSILSHFNWSYSKALISVFPDIGLEETKFAVIPNNYWNNVQNRREFFRKYAEEKGFNYLVADNWYNVKLDELLQDKAARSMLLRHYDGKLGPALIHLFPEINFENFISEKSKVSEEIKHKIFFETISNELGFDFNAADNWYQIKKDLLRSRKGGNAVLKYYNNNLFAALSSVFPHVKFNSSKFDNIHNKSHWKSVENQRLFLEDFARKNNFNPKVASNWYSVTSHSLLSQPGGPSVLGQYGGSVAEAVIQIFPEISFDRFKFLSMPHNYWKEEKNQRSRFEAFAKENGFDPLVASNWYSMNFDELRNYKGIGSIVHYYNSSIIECLCTIFPEIGLDKTLFAKKPNKFWMDVKNQKKVLLDFAKANNFDPEVAENWYNINFVELRTFKNAKPMLAHYNGSVADAVSSIFTELTFERNKFYKTFKMPKSHWAQEDNRRKFFEDFLESKGQTSFSPSRTYSTEIYKLKQVRSVLRYYNNSIYTALTTLFPQQMKS